MDYDPTSRILQHKRLTKLCGPFLLSILFSLLFTFEFSQAKTLSHPSLLKPKNLWRFVYAISFTCGDSQFTFVTPFKYCLHQNGCPDTPHVIPSSFLALLGISLMYHRNIQYKYPQQQHLVDRYLVWVMCKLAVAVLGHHWFISDSFLYWFSY